MSASRRVALIDDDRTWLETLAEYLSDRGYGVETALGGRRGLRLLERGDIGLAVVDFHMPDLDGVELLRHLRRQRLNVDVLLMSSDDDPALPRRILAEGAAAFLSKNEAPGLLLRSLTQTLSSVFAEMARRPAAHSPWDRFLPMLLRRDDSERN
jgi:two-component system response regulator DctR